MIANPPQNRLLGTFGKSKAEPESSIGFTGDRLHETGLHQSMGTVKYPAQATQRRSSISHVPESGTHGLKGGF